MKNKRSILQKTSLVTGIICEILCVFCLVMLVITVRELGLEDIISASYIASAFFFFTAGFVLIVISQPNPPSMGFNDSVDDK